MLKYVPVTDTLKTEANQTGYFLKVYKGKAFLLKCYSLSLSVAKYHN